MAFQKNQRQINSLYSLINIQIKNRMQTNYKINTDKLIQIKDQTLRQKIERDRFSENPNQVYDVQGKKETQKTSKDDNNLSQHSKFNISVQHPNNVDQNNQITKQESEVITQKQNRQRRLYTFNINSQNDNMKSKQVHEIENELKQIEQKMKRKSIIMEVDQQFSQRKPDSLNHSNDQNNRSNEHEMKDFTPPIHNQIAQNAHRTTQILFIPNFSDVRRINQQEQKEFDSDSQNSDQQYQNYKSQQDQTTPEKKNSNNDDQEQDQQQEQKNDEIQETNLKTTPKFDNRQNIIEFSEKQNQNKPMIQPMSFNIVMKQQVKAEAQIRCCKCNIF